MRTAYCLLITAHCLLLSACGDNPVPPVAKIVPYEITAHGHTRIDNYYWLSERDSPDVLDYLKQENDYAEAMMRGTEKMQEIFFNELKNALVENEEADSYIKSGYKYYTRYEEGQNHPIYCRVKTGEEKEEILLNENEMAQGYAYYKISEYAVSPDNRLIAFSIDTVSRRLYTILVKDLQTGKMLTTEIPHTSGSIIWANDSKTFFYVLRDTVSLRSCKAMRHTIADNNQKDVCLHTENDNMFSVGIEKTASQDVILISCYSRLTDEYYYIDANKPNSKPVVIQPRMHGVRYYVDCADGKFYIRTNYKAVNFRIMEAPITNPGINNWKDIVPPNPERFIQSMRLYKDYIVALERVNGLEQIRIVNKSDKSVHYIDFDDENYYVTLKSNPDYESNKLCYTYSSLKTPASIMEYDLQTNVQSIISQTQVPGYNPDDYASERVWATADDGKRIPISLVYKKGIIRDGSNPMLLYAYGSYGNVATSRPAFNTNHLPLLNRGFIYAIAHVRGGGYLGREWYEGGRLLNKRNTFTDFIACAEYLIAEKYTSSNVLIARGISAGGLLMGAIANMKPALFKGIIANVPFVDVVTTQLDETIPLAAVEYQEWGNAHIKEEYEYMLSYSPYDNVSAQDYPAMLVTTGYHDSQVQYFEPAKWVAKLRAFKTDRNLLLFTTNMSGGHSGGAGRYDSLQDLAFGYAFIFKILND